MAMAGARRKLTAEYSMKILEIVMKKKFTEISMIRQRRIQ